MAVNADPITLRKLALARRLYQHAIAQASHNTSTARIVAIMSFDLATETLLRAAVGSLDISRTPADGFPGLIQQIETLLAAASLGALPDRANIHHVHSIRNDAQHRARQASETEVSDARTYTRDFMRKATMLVWGLSIDAVSLVDLVQHSRLRDFLHEAELAFQAKEFVKVAEQSATALTLAIEYVEEVFVGRLPGFVNGFAMQDAWGKPTSPHDSRDAFRAFERMRETVLISALGLNYADHIRFRQLAGEVDFMMDGSAQPRGAKPALSEAEAEFVLSYAVDAVHEIEGKVGDIEKPFGAERW